MKKKSAGEQNDELRPEYDLGPRLKTGVQGKHAERFQEGKNLVPLTPDGAEAFPTAAAVNETLPLVLQLTELRAKKRQPQIGGSDPLPR